MDSNCTCGRIAVGMTVTEHRNWNRNCPEHGTGSEWWNSDEQRTKRAARAKELADLWGRAQQARQRKQTPPAGPTT